MNRKMSLHAGFCIVLSLALVTCFASGAAFAAADWPAKPVTLLVGYSAGGSSDLGARFLAQSLEKYLGRPVIVENRPGSGSWIAWNQLLYNTPKDGYTFALTNLSLIFGAYDQTNPRKETIDDFELLANQAIDYQVVAIRKDETRFSDYATLIEYSKNNDILVAAAASGITSGESSIGKMMEKEFGSKIIIVPVEGSKDAETMFISRNTDILFGNVGDSTIGHKNGDFKVIVVFAQERSKMLPDVPTARELGLGDYVSFSARGYSYAKGVDPAIAAKMRDALAKAIEDPEHIKRMDEMGVEIKLYAGDEYRRVLEEQLDSRLEIWGISK
jgi:tripartite-type tricarboxylate transporter receptor subunit TctC